MQLTDFQLGIQTWRSNIPFILRLFLMLEVSLLSIGVCCASLRGRGPYLFHISSEDSLQCSFHQDSSLVWLLSSDLASQANVGIQRPIINVGIDGAEGSPQLICAHLSVERQHGHCCAMGKEQLCPCATARTWAAWNGEQGFVRTS